MCGWAFPKAHRAPDARRRESSEPALTRINLPLSSPPYLRRVPQFRYKRSIPFTNLSTEADEDSPIPPEECMAAQARALIARNAAGQVDNVFSELQPC